MNSAHRFELQNIRDDQDRLHRLVRDLDLRINVLARNLIAEPQTPKLVPVEIKPEPEPELAKPPPLPPIEALPDFHSVKPEPEPGPTPKPKAEVAPIPQPAPLLPIPTKPEPTTDEPLELRVGTFWMARIGIVILLTGLVFLGNYAYQRIVPTLGPAGKVSLLMLAGLGLGGAGYWMERAKENLRNFGRVLFAGGAATIYYTTYAAHFVQGLRVIESALVGGLLLLAVAGGIAWYAERKRSETIASLAILLSYYTSAINSIAGFTLFSSLLLTAVAVYFLIRHQWTRLSVMSLMATYGSYAFWRFHQAVQHGAAGELGMGAGFLAGYWALFTAAVFFTASSALRSVDRVAFLTMNNIAFFAFTAHRFAVGLPEAFWVFAIGFGGVLLALSALASYRGDEESSIDGAYLAQGLIAITAGIFAKFSGPQLAMILALESAALLACVRRRHGVIYEIGSGFCALAAFTFALAQINSFGSWWWSLGTPVAALLIFNAWWIKYLRGDLQMRAITGRALAFSTLGLILAGNVVWQATPDAWRPAAFALVPLLGLGAFRVRLAEVGFGTQFFLLFAAGLVFAQFDPLSSLPWWTPAPVVASALVLLHCWQSRQEPAESKAASNAMQLVFAAIATGVGICWMRGLYQGDAWLIATSATAVAAVGYGLLTRASSIPLVGQAYTVLAGVSFVKAIIAGHPAWAAAFAPVAMMTIISVLVSRWGAKRWPALSESTSYAEIAWCYRVGAAVLLGLWAMEYVPSAWRVVFFTLGGSVQIVAGSLIRSRSRLITGTVYAIAGIVLFWLRFAQPVTLPDLVALISIPLGLRITKHLTGESPIPNALRNAMVTMVLVSVWLWVTRWTLDRGVLGQLTTSWTMLALIVFAAGLTLRERVYRLGGFVILGLAMGRLFVFDVWKFDSLYRILSFLVLGAALLALSFVYHRFSETLRKYL
jgi:uncharacterized membrane protein